jgi:hypothetical protein
MNPADPLALENSRYVIGAIGVVAVVIIGLFARQQK